MKAGAARVQFCLGPREAGRECRPGAEEVFSDPETAPTTARQTVAQSGKNTRLAGRAADELREPPVGVARS
ncbi:hypothetical protein HPB50_020146 [Hyalomma asiaticum]|uniref:Uncharacterized protein n=1 Tax=Hyalomma asiaticum TaxID=266040 RepID=A0ACB7TNH3_HYAAI|nr:hypothetical protein HPB50_020146 [Hyalomma asiaticum]